MRGSYVEDTPERPRPLPDAAFTQAAQDPLQGVDFSKLTIEQYAALRGQLGIGQARQEGVGLFNQPASADAPRANVGRTHWSVSNVVEAPRIGRAFVNHDAQRDRRTLGERFGTPGNSFQI